MRKTKLSDEALRELSHKKKSISTIAKQFGLQKETVRRRLKKLSPDVPTEVTTESVRVEIKKEATKREESNNVKKIKLLAAELLRVEIERDAFLAVGDIETYEIKRNVESIHSCATIVVLASDWHYEEPVKSSQVNGLNKFDTTIAKERIEEFFRVIAQLIKVHQREYTIDNLILALLGDFISGSIHDDLKEANMIQPTQAIWEVQNLISSGIEYLLKETNVNLVIPCSSGNHGRITDKQRVATEFGNSLEILMYRQMQKYFAKEDRIKFLINDSYLTYVKVYEYSLRFSHGHAIRYAGGVGGIFIPTFKAISQWNKSKHADWDFFGHFHQLKDGGNFVSNGSLIGFNAFAVKIKADYEQPKQAFIIIDESRGMDCVRKITLS